jgi:APA family basic amino acid/polyamine antiporter
LFGSNRLLFDVSRAASEAVIQPVPRALQRGLGQLDATALVVGILIGSGIFIVSAESARLVGAPGWLLCAWGVAGIMTLAGAQCGAELGAMMPRAGGQYVFLREAYGSTVAFLFGWTLFLVLQTGKIAAVAVAFASFTGVLVEWVSPANYIVHPIVLGRYAISLSSQQLVAIASIVVLTVANVHGLETGKLIQNTLTAVKTAAFLGLIVLGLSLGWNPESAAFTAQWWDPWANGWTPQEARPGFALTGGLALAMLLGQAVVGPLFSQSGWNNVTFTGGEVREPGRNLPRALLAGTTIVVALYLLANLAYLVTLPLPAIQHAPQNRVGTAMMQALLGTSGAVVMAAAIMVSTFSCNNGLVLGGARVFYAMASDRLFFAHAGRLNRRRVPAAALVAQCAWATLLTLPRTVTMDPATGAVRYGNVYTQLLEYIISADLVFYGLLAGAVVVLRLKAPLADRPYRVIGYPFTPALYIGLAAVLALDLAYLAPTTSGMGYLLALSGLPIYLLWRRHAKPPRSVLDGAGTEVGS